MEARVYKIVDKAKAKEVLETDEVKRFGYIQRDGATLGVGEGDYVYIEATPEIFKLIEESGAFERPENEEEVKKKIQEEQEAAMGGVGFLGM
ncbi:MAG: hypothetical protein PWP76_766 [Candidatus Diapherotrites archaeon]|nr:hypothetical protein [Candidatus Diapherotrites archaeon]MDN5367074.1 hypothetical protein [Candidatus Diapherotrites archaeon]